MSDQSGLFHKYNHFFNELISLYDLMDQAYDSVAGAYGFECSGCHDNCCMTRFFHHTHIEFLYLHKGFAGLPENLRDEIRQQAAVVNEKVCQAEKDGRISRVMCPLNRDGRCVIYEYRPMICRLHGIPHELQHPVRGRMPGPGCHEFEAKCGRMPYVEFDRTPFYQQMAGLERRVREITGSSDRFKKTVSEMLVEDIGNFL